jgi:hypothetical protein
LRWSVLCTSGSQGVCVCGGGGRGGGLFSLKELGQLNFAFKQAVALQI